MKISAAEREVFFHFLDKFQPLEEEAAQAFCAAGERVVFAKKTLLTRAAESEKYLYFVLNGVQRIYNLKENGQENVLIFTYAPSFSGIVDALMLKKEARFYLETLTESHFLRFPIESIEKLQQDYPTIQALIQKATLMALSGVLTRLAEQLQCNAEERFRLLLQRSPHLLQLVPHKYLASYLGIDATNFSKIFNKFMI
ncbi:Crp/Fnr family transcriptional regulator [Hugenholtzia roseola]|uniref:Crp/Fnr family transcriptional regulator n=1 Tax=Hugenholtzia roseola TaxID=1002 RepID=UPI00054EF7E6|nr:Crp/Fnr family transcriptional regulator [Hugenholtzia roseola]